MFCGCNTFLLSYSCKSVDNVNRIDRNTIIYHNYVILMGGRFILYHSCLTFSHEHSHNLIFDSPKLIPLVDFVLDFVASSFGENLKYVYSHSRSHHPNLGDKTVDSEILTRQGDCPHTDWVQYLVQLSPMAVPGVAILNLLLGFNKKGNSVSSIPVPKEWNHRKLVSLMGSISGIVFVFLQCGWV
eukprot:UN26486